MGPPFRSLRPPIPASFGRPGPAGRMTLQMAPPPLRPLYAWNLLDLGLSRTGQIGSKQAQPPNESTDLISLRFPSRLRAEGFENQAFDGKEFGLSVGVRGINRPGHQCLGHILGKDFMRFTTQRGWRSKLTKPQVSENPITSAAGSTRNIFKCSICLLYAEFGTPNRIAPRCIKMWQLGSAHR